jgi:integrase
LISTATGQLRLHLLLMANCGFTQQDISDLHPREFRDGCLVRKRSKTRDHENVPEVRYRLWPETLALLKEYRSDDPKHLLVTKSGRAWVHKEFKGGKFVETDSIRTLYSRHARSVGVTMSLKHIRKTSATMIDRETKSFDHRIATLFLGHSPRSIKDRHYSRPAEDVLDEAVKWLRGVYFPKNQRSRGSQKDGSPRRR